MKNKPQNAPDLADAVDIIFPEAIEVNGKDETEFQLVRQPIGTDLGNYTFTDLLEGSVQAFARVTPRLIQPYLHPKQIKQMGARNLLALTVAYSSFLVGVDMDGMAEPADGPKTSQTPTTASTPSAQKAG